MTGPRARHRRQQGAALLIAMLILTLVATLASAMVWHQQRAIEVETADRAATQADAMLTAILDTARFFIRTLPAGTPLVNGTGISQELRDMRLADLLAADRDNTVDSTLEAFFSAQITDAQGRYNLRRLVGEDGKPVAREVEGLRRLCSAIGLAPEIADRLAGALGTAWSGQDDIGPMAPGTVDQLQWVGLDATTLELLRPHVTILPGRTAVNANNATAAALVAAIDGLDAAHAQILLNRRPPTGWKELSAVAALLPEGVKAEEGRVNTRTNFFDLRASVRLGDRQRLETWLLQTRSDRNEVAVLRHQRQSLNVAAQ